MITYMMEVVYFLFEFLFSHKDTNARGEKNRKQKE